MSALKADRFDYSHAEWIAIENAVATVRPGSLTDFEARRLLNAANKYLITAREQRHTKARLAEISKRWKLVEKLGEELSSAITSATAALALVPREVAKLSPALAELREVASALSEGHGALGRDAFGPKRSFYGDVLKVWTDRGGKLGWSTNAQVGGPCVRYFNAVVRPVMGADSPKQSYVRDIIDDEKRRREGTVIKMKKPRISRA